MVLLLPWLAACTGSRTCVADSDCDDGNPCTGQEVCDAGACALPAPMVCSGPAVCFVREGRAVCDELCGLPMLPAVGTLLVGQVLDFGAPVDLAVGDGAPTSLAQWTVPDQLAPVTLEVTFPQAACSRSRTYDVAVGYPGAADTPNSRAVPAAEATRWATDIAGAQFGDEVDERWRDPSLALGPAEGTAGGAVPLGRGGSIVVGFEPALADGPGADLAVYENSFADDFLELGRVEVSTDGVTFARFDAVSLVTEPIDAFGSMDPTLVTGFSGKVRAGFGTPFDLSWLLDHDLVRTGQLDLQHIRYVRVVDVVGDGSESDYFGRPIFDPFPTVMTAGFDLDGVAALEAP